MEFLDYLLRGAWKKCPYCKTGFTRREWFERDRETGGHATCKKDIPNA